VLKRGGSQDLPEELSREPVLTCFPKEGKEGQKPSERVGKVTRKHTFFNTDRGSENRKRNNKAKGER